MPDDNDKTATAQNEDGQAAVTKSLRMRQVIALGAEFAGGAAGGVAGFFVAGPGGAALAGAGGVVLTKGLLAAGEEVCDRLLGPREKVRVGGALAVSMHRVEERLAAGEALRDDSFVGNGNGRSPMNETAEGLLLAAQRAYDEKKVPFIGRLLANLNFQREIGIEAASVLVRMADQLSYQQLCLLRILYDNHTGRSHLTGGKIENGRVKNAAHGALLSDLMDLERNALINNGGEAVLDMTTIDPPIAELQGFGGHIFKLMQLDLIPEPDLQAICQVLNEASVERTTVCIAAEPPPGGYEPLTDRIRAGDIIG